MQTNTGDDVRLRDTAKRWRLTPRETEVLKQVAVDGEPNKVIAANLGCAEATVEAHVTRVLAKAGASSRVALAISYWRAPLAVQGLATQGLAGPTS